MKAWNDMVRPRAEDYLGDDEPSPGNAQCAFWRHRTRARADYSWL